MKYRPLGNTGLRVSEIAFGGVGIGLPYADQPKPSKESSLELLESSLDHGINFYDTARMYGESEALIGEAFSSRRHDIVIATKAAHFLNKDGSLPPDDVVENIIRNSLEESLRTLRTEYVDVFMLHQANKVVLQSPAIHRLFSSLREEGLVRFTGASTYEPEESRLCMESGIWDVIQIPANILDQSHLRLLELAERYGIGVIVRSVLFRGMLTGRPLDLHPALREVQFHIERLRGWEKDHIEDLYTLAVKFILSYPAVSAALIGMDKKEHLKKALDVTESSVLTESTRSELEEMAFENPGLLNLNTWIKNGWLKN